VQEVSLPQVQDLAFVFAEFHEASVGPFLQPVKMSTLSQRLTPCGKALEIHTVENILIGFHCADSYFQSYPSSLLLIFNFPLLGIQQM